MSPTLAIDFGSSRTKIAYLCPDGGKPKIVELGQEIRAIMPSVFYIPQSGPVLVGDEAAQMADEDPAGIVTDIKRELHRPGKIRCGEGRPTYQRWELVSILFSEIRRRCDKEVFHNGLIDSCMLTVPVCFSEPQRQKLRHAAENAGFTSVRLLEEPTAAAMHWLSSSGKNVSDHVIVVDIGGGTTDLAALKLCGSTYESIPDLPSSGFAAGGNDIDEEVRRVIGRNFECEEGESGALLFKLRQVKERLTKMNSDVFTINLAGRTQAIPRNVVEIAVRTLVEKTCAEASRFLKDFEEVTGRADAPVLLAGGGSRLTGMQEALADVAGAERVFIWNDGEYAIALGATLAGNRSRTTVVHVGPPVLEPKAQPVQRPTDESPMLPVLETKAKPVGAPAAEESSSMLLAKLQRILFSGHGLAKARQDITENMVRVCEAEAKRGSARAQALLGDCYSEGWHVEKDVGEAVKWFRLAAEQGNAFGQCELGLCYLRGDVVEYNPKEAVKWFRLSADQGNATAKQSIKNLSPMQPGNNNAGHVSNIQKSTPRESGFSVGLIFFIAMVILALMIILSSMS